MKKIIIIALLLFILVFNASCGGAKKQTIIFEEEWSNSDNITVFLTAGWETTYCFILTSDRRLITVKGLDSIHHVSGEHVEVEAYAEKNLANEEWNDVSYIKNILGDFNGAIWDVYDVWTVIYYADGKEYYYTYGLSKNEMYDLFIVKLIHYSEIEVVDKQGEPVVPYSLDRLSDTNFGNYYETESEKA